MNTEKPKHINIYMTKSKYLFTLIFLLSFMPGSTQTIKFNSNKECKIIQFTDIHYKSGSPRHSAKSLIMMAYVVDIYNPELDKYQFIVHFWHPSCLQSSHILEQFIHVCFLLCYHSLRHKGQSFMVQISHHTLHLEQSE